MNQPIEGRTPPLTGFAALVAVVAWTWLAMMLVHELGHVAAAYATGGRLESLELRPGYLSHTLARPNPRPEVVLWGGFLVGWITPQLTAPVWRIRAGMVGPAVRAWAAFCLLAGGSYLAVGGGERLTDTGQLLAEGWPPATLIAIGGGVAAIGYLRSRAAWITIAQRLSSDRVGWRAALGWWLFLAAWIAGQRGLHTALGPA